MKAKPVVSVKLSARFVTIELPPDSKRVRLDADAAFDLSDEILRAACQLSKKVWARRPRPRRPA